MLTSSHCRLDLDMRFKVLLLESEELLARAAVAAAGAAFVFLDAAPAADLSALPAAAPVLDSLAALLADFTFGMAPVGRIVAAELHAASTFSCCSSAAAEAAAAAAAITAVAGPAEAERAARSMDTFGVSGEQ